MHRLCKHSTRKRSPPYESIKTDTATAVYITKSLEMSEETNNPVNRVTTDKLQPLLINLIIRSILKTKVSQGFIATRLKCGETLNDQLYTHC